MGVSVPRASRKSGKPSEFTSATLMSPPQHPPIVTRTGGSNRPAGLKRTVPVDPSDSKLRFVRPEPFPENTLAGLVNCTEPLKVWF
jgi:hypothetical protein